MAEALNAAAAAEEEEEEEDEEEEEEVCHARGPRCSFIMNILRWKAGSVCACDSLIRRLLLSR